MRPWTRFAVIDGPAVTVPAVSPPATAQDLDWGDDTGPGSTPLLSHGARAGAVEFGLKNPRVLQFVIR